MDIRRNILYLSFLTCAVAFAGFGGFVLANRKTPVVVRKTEIASEEISEVNNEELTVQNTDFIRDSFDGSITYMGDKYEVNTNLDTILFLGIDTSDQTREGVGIVEGGRSDVIILFVLDDAKKTITPIQINRDTMVDVDIYDNEGNFLSTGVEQLTMQYSYGDSPKKASNLTRQKVSDLFGRKRINGVISLTMEGIEPIVNSIGGVIMQLSEDETEFDPTYTKDAVIKLDGKKALDFLHRRDVKKRGSNIDRMNRQTEFMLALFKNIQESGAAVIETIENAAGEHLYEDASADSLNHLTEYDFSGEVLNLPGTNIEGLLHDEFNVDEEELNKFILNIFYTKEG